LKAHSPENKSRLKIIEGIIQLYTTEMRRDEPTTIELAKMAAAWNVHFNRAKIPSDKLLELYYDAFSEWDGKGLFSHANMIQEWKKTASIIDYGEYQCPICDGSKMVKVYSFEEKKEVEKFCACNPASQEND
jgi:hypothetical protein